MYKTIVINKEQNLAIVRYIILNASVDLHMMVCIVKVGVT